MDIEPLAVIAQPSLVAATRKHHGLGNRVRVVLGARSLARVEGRRFFYVWQTGPQFDAKFSDLWKVSEREIALTTARVLSLRYPFRDETLRWLPEARNERVLQIRTPHALVLPDGATPWEEELQQLHPVEEISAAVHEFFDAHLAGEPYIGVMVRAHEHSHAATLKESPVEWYLTRMREIREIHPKIRFFVSADTREAELTVVENIPGAVALANKGGYNSRAGLRSSVADLYLLAASSHVLAPHFSSFPELAQKLAGPGLRLETSMTGAPSRLEASDMMWHVIDPTHPHVRQHA